MYSEKEKQKERDLLKVQQPQEQKVVDLTVCLKIQEMIFYAKRFPICTERWTHTEREKMGMDGKKKYKATMLLQFNHSQLTNQYKTFHIQQ